MEEAWDVPLVLLVAFRDQSQVPSLAWEGEGAFGVVEEAYEVGAASGVVVVHLVQVLARLQGALVDHCLLGLGLEVSVGEAQWVVVPLSSQVAGLELESWDPL